jgi:hypothetical protein
MSRFCSLQTAVAEAVHGVEHGCASLHIDVARERALKVLRRVRAETEHAHSAKENTCPSR